MERKIVNGTEYIVKTFDVARNITEEMLIEEDFESEGYKFTHTNTDRKENVSESVRHETRQATLNSSTNSRAEILSQFTQSINYSEDGYAGTLTLDTNSLNTQVSGYGSRSVSISRTREHKNLMFNDPSFVPQSITEDGVTLTLTNIDWVVTGTALAGDALVPTEYKAVALYSGTQHVSYILGYVTTVNYSGLVNKRTVDSINFTITYTGTPLPTTTAAATEPPPITEPPVEETEPEVIPEETATADDTDSEIGDEQEDDENEEKEKSSLLGILTAAGIALLAAAAVFGVIYYFMRIRKKQLKMEIYNLVENEYTLLGVEILTEAELTVDLNKYGESVQSNSFGFGLDKHTVDTLDGCKINITYKEEVHVHTVNKSGNLKEYLFKFVFGEYF